MASTASTDPLAPETLREQLARSRYDVGEYQPDGVFCPACNALRRVWVTRLRPSMIPEEVYELRAGVIISIKCMQCNTEALGVLDEEGWRQSCNRREKLTLYWPTIAKLATANTPEAVAYYLDQAARCESVGANSAAVVMYRSALEHLLHDHNYKEGMLGRRLSKLLADVAAGSAPRWARDIDHAYLDVINKLGNGAVHANDGDVSKQASLDDEIFRGLQIAFVEILDVVYERPARAAATLAKLQEASGKFVR